MKVHHNTWWMSEDIGIKLVPDEETLAHSREKQRQLRRRLHHQIISLIQKSGTFTLKEKPKKCFDDQRMHSCSLRDIFSLKLMFMPISTIFLA
ncbi:hypothetical protein MNBD_GAMMA18-972 [hydrothermal vent metagenome]|uniref:Uncharacterized protein n=1 Tax=hydrothermal vent metagenome TaxID=652676 RepID=A0A3B0Z570_9ZZZZ